MKSTESQKKQGIERYRGVIELKAAYELSEAAIEFYKDPKNMKAFKKWKRKNSRKRRARA